MARIAGMRMVKNKAGKITHVVLSTKHYRKVLEDLIDATEMESARKGDVIPWEEARDNINEKFSFKA